MAENPEIPKIYLFRLENWSLEKEKALLEKLKSEGDGVFTVWNKYEVPNHPEIKNYYFVPDETDVINRVKKVALTNTSFLLNSIGSFDPFDVPDSVFGFSNPGFPIWILGIGILLLIILLGVLK
ncbi:hypothetical protein [Leptospira santarosai]|uniref:Uncharacterized protein n=1 Tax=Leptospira santarosai str. ZUN179 TaxID=1049985 RepID=M6UNF2_9LEPT|nr:hypothetical protein [Leptospira santarosai]EMO46662.1 hypothetical protein LEP1GSC187_2184 [Leptospira santarosai str. ZUN179]